MDWANAGVIIAATAAIGTLIGWLLPSPIQIQNRLANLEKDLAVLVSTVNTLRQTVDNLVQYTRQGFGNNDNSSGSGRRSKL